jgi:hypothetical protein
MNVDVHVLGSDLNSEVQRGPVARVNGRAIPRLRGSDQKRIPKWPAVYEELSAASGGLGIAGTLNVPAHTKGAECVFNRDERAGKIAPPHSRQPLHLVLIGGHRQPATPVHVQLESGFGVRERQCRHSLVGGARLTRC